MRCNANSFAVPDTYRSIRRDFERQMGLRSSGPAAELTISESDARVSVHLDVPGVSEDALSVTVHDGHLVIEGERSSAATDGSATVFCNRVFGKFRRVLKLDEAIDPDSVDAVLENGVLAISLSRRPEVQPKKITVRSAT